MPRTPLPAIAKQSRAAQGIPPVTRVDPARPGNESNARRYYVCVMPTIPSSLNNANELPL
jgi:hypothetical protein